MIINKEIRQFIILDEDNIKNALSKIEINEHGMIVCVNNSNIFKGVLTDGDIRRWLLTQRKLNLNIPVNNIMNKKALTANVNDHPDKIRNIFLENKSISFLPLLDNRNRCLAIATNKSPSFQIGDNKIGVGHPCFVIAEIGNNHNGSITNAFKLIDEAKKAGADCVKFQMRDMKNLYSNKGKISDEKEDLGSQYTLDLLNKFQLSKKDMFKAFDYCKKRNIIPLCTPWDISSVEKLEKYNLQGYKTASADLSNYDLLKRVSKTGKPMICSTGMSKEVEIIDTVQHLKSMGAKYSLLHCNSTYPAPFKDLNINYINSLRKIGQCPVGYSSHDRGINIVIASVALGANIIEKHFTLDTKMEGNDHRVSIETQDFTLMVNGIRQVEESLGKTNGRSLSQGEMINRETLGKSIFVKKNIKKGIKFQDDMLVIKSPGKGLQPNKKTELLKKVANRNIKSGEILYESDLKGEKIIPRKYKFKRPFGIPVRYHDINKLDRKSNFDFLEFHLSYKDIELDEARFLKKKYNLDFLVHAPELFSGDHILDLCSENEQYRKTSINNLKKIIKISKRLKKKFIKSSKVKVIVNVGGYSMDRQFNQKEKINKYNLLKKSLNELQNKDVEILPQTMPPFPWHFGGQRYHNLFVNPEEIVQFCSKNNYKVCLDISHAKLACNHFKWSFNDYVKKVGKFSNHLHIADAKGVDGEGLQINKGEIDFAELGILLENYCPKSTFIPEIWQGHKDNGEGFWKAFERLENFF